MTPRQTVPRQWLVADRRLGENLWRVLESLPPGSGVLILFAEMPRPARARLLRRVRSIAARRKLLLADEAEGEAARVHGMAELRRAQSRRVPLLFVSPVFATRSHPGRAPLPPMRAAALTRLAKAPAIALGGMDERRFKRVERLGFQGWAGIDAWLKVAKVTR